MGLKPMRECRKLNCHILTRNGYCDKHRDEIIKSERQRQHRYDKYQRCKEADTFYKSKAWNKARELSLAIHYGLCQDCLAQGIYKQADMVHHVQALRDYPHLALVQSNLRPLCNKCHAKY